MAVKISNIDRELANMVDTVASTLEKTRSLIANNMGSQIALHAASGRTRFTPAVSKSALRSSLNATQGTWREGRRSRILRTKHVLAIKVLKHYKRPLKWADIDSTAKTIFKAKDRSRSFLRAGFCFPGYMLHVAANREREKIGDRVRAVAARNANCFGPKALRFQRFSGVRPARKTSPAVIINQAASLTARRTVPDYERFIFSRGNPAQFKALGDRGINKAINQQLRFERRTLPKALDTVLKRKAARGRSLGAAARKLLS